MPRLLALLPLLLLAACSNAPEQPSDEPEVQSDVPAEEEEIVISDIPEPPNATESRMSDVLGEWAPNAEACAATGDPPVTISATRYEGLAESCEISELVDSGDGFTASLMCESDGVTDAALLKLTPDGDTLALDWVGRDETEIVLVRCE